MTRYFADYYRPHSLHTVVGLFSVDEEGVKLLTYGTESGDGDVLPTLCEEVGITTLQLTDPGTTDELTASRMLRKAAQ